MGEHEVSDAASSAARRTFVRALLDDVAALERMIEEGRFEEGVRCIGAEQEVFIVDRAWRPAPLATELLARLGGGPYTTELARFNLECNMTPRPLGGDCLSALEREVTDLLARLRQVASEYHARLVLVGILPTLRQADLTLANMTPNPRYALLNDVMSELCGGRFHTLIKGLDELQLTHDNVMLEACNTSFQIHFQVGPREFPKLYNLAQVVTAPVLAAAVNSPVLLHHRLWKETRVALFQQSLDVRSGVHKARGTRQRVTFGDDWLRESVLEIFQEDIARFRVLLSTETNDESSMGLLDRGIVPKLRALCLHNGTVYRWNRACYGVADGQPHLRIENRVLPSGPTVLDEVANAAFYFGVMTALGDEHTDITRVMSFDDAKANFIGAARYGLKARFQWLGGRPHTAEDVILQELVPAARAGLASRGVDAADVDRYLGTIEERVKLRRTGAQWALDSLAAMATQGTAEERASALTAAMAANEAGGLPVHRWELATLGGTHEWRHSYKTVGQVMTTDLFTVRPEDLVDLAASLMEWRHLRHVPVEDDEGRLVGLLSHRALLRLIGRGLQQGIAARAVAVKEIMKPDPVTVEPDTNTLAAIKLMRERKVGCLPVVKDGILVGIVSERDFIEAAAKLLEEELSKP